MEPAEREELAELIAAASASGLAARIAAAEGVRREHPFAFVLGAGGPLITGVIDLLAREGSGRLLVVDYKSDRVPAGADLRGARRARLRAPARDLRARGAARGCARGRGRALVPGAPRRAGRRELRAGRPGAAPGAARRAVCRPLGSAASRSARIPTRASAAAVPAAAASAPGISSRRLREAPPTPAGRLDTLAGGGAGGHGPGIAPQSRMSARTRVGSAFRAVEKSVSGRFSGRPCADTLSGSASGARARVPRSSTPRPARATGARKRHPHRALP